MSLLKKLEDWDKYLLKAMEIKPMKQPTMAEMALASGIFWSFLFIAGLLTMKACGY